MKSNKGFTLIELLAVIVILAIIALIATPIILGVIETARKGSAENSALGYIDAVEKQIAIDMLAATPSDKVLQSYELGDDITTFTEVKVKGATPEGGVIKTDNSGTVINGTCLTIKLNGTDYKVEYNGSKATATAKATCVSGS